MTSFMKNLKKFKIIYINGNIPLNVIITSSCINRMILNIIDYHILT